VRLNLSSAVPGATTLVSPADGAVNVAKQPALVWGAATQATTYHVDISQTSNFSQIVYSADVSEETTLAVDIYLESLSTYYWRVRGVNACGNGAWSPTFRFTTVSQLDYFTEEFTGTSDPVDLDYLTLRLTPDGSADFYSACLEVAASLPTDPAGGTYVALGDDGSAAVSVPQPVQLYGVPYSTLYINANANITFGQSDGTWEESLNSHFGLPRIAALFDDLNPLSNTTSYKILVNRVVVTGVDVPELYDGGANTYQVELYYDGTIQITWLGLTCSDAIIGLSAGDGLPPDFLESQLAGMPVCPPPSACCTGEACTLLTEYDCAAAGGVFAGPDVACTPNPCVSYDSSCLIISEVVQGGESGNCPRWVELTNTGGTDFAFIEGGLIVQTGTSTDVNVDVDLSGVVIPAGQAYVINSNFSGACTGAFPAIYGFEPHRYSNTEFCFGDERLILTDTSDGSHLIDIYGEFGVDGTGQPWEFTTGYAYRRPEWTYGAGPQFHLSEWVVGGVGSLLGDNPTEMLLTLTTPGLHAIKQACTLNYRGDLNCDGAVDFGDINAFVLALTNPDTYAAQFPGCPLANRDVDRNGVFDFADINPFIQVLSSLR
jgi:hypothetical protein